MEPIAKMGLLIGLTGGIASGKSTVAALLAENHIPVIDTDQLSRELVEPGQPALTAIVEAFGPEVLQADHRLDRTALRVIVLNNPQARARLEGILHPPIRRLAQQRALELATTHPYVVIVIPLLAETSVYPHYQWLDYIVNVDAQPEQQRTRRLNRPGIDIRQANQLIQAQTTDDQRRMVTDFCLDNTGDLPHLKDQIRHLHHELLKRAAAIP
ncbi:MAG: dephospho-CoA kinase [Halothiobacillus sp.]|jgi:dephospho-CoA kinase|nr:dephospho-CoA kinase [Halothiobacillus sp.]